MTASAKTVPGTADHDSCMIAPTVPHRKGPQKDSWNPSKSARTLRWNSVAANRHGIVSRNHSVAAFPPSDCRPALRKDLRALTRSFRFRIPQPPAPRGRQDRVCSHDKEGQRELVLFCLYRDVSASTDISPSQHKLSPLILRSREAASRRIEVGLHEPGLHGSRGDAQHRPPRAQRRAPHREG
jgi:hypothetical protein